MIKISENKYIGCTQSILTNKSPGLELLLNIEIFIYRSIRKETKPQPKNRLINIYCVLLFVWMIDCCWFSQKNYNLWEMLYNHEEKVCRELKLHSESPTTDISIEQTIRISTIQLITSWRCTLPSVCKCHRIYSSMFIYLL